eukprot:9398054-Karenia_brevis.AAC.1
MILSHPQSFSSPSVILSHSQSFLVILSHSADRHFGVLECSGGCLRDVLWNVGSVLPVLGNLRGVLGALIRF